MSHPTSPPPDESRTAAAVEMIRDAVGRLRYALSNYATEIAQLETIKTTEKMRLFERRMREHVQGFCWATAWPRCELGRPAAFAHQWSEQIHHVVGNMWLAIHRVFRPTTAPGAPATDASRYRTVIDDTTDIAPLEWEATVESAYRTAAGLATAAAARLLDLLAGPIAPGRPTGIGTSDGLVAPLPQGS